MKIYVASNDPTITTCLRECFRRLGVEYPSSHAGAPEAVLPQLEQDTAPQAAVLFADAAAVELVLGQLSNRPSPPRVVAVGANLSPPAILKAIRAGASDCLDIAGNLAVELRELLERIQLEQANPRTTQQSSHTIAVVGAGGGVGTTLIATNLGALLAQRGLRTALLDLHVRGGDVATFLNCQPRHTLAALAAKKDEVDLAMFEQSLFEHDCGLYFLAGPAPFSDLRSLRPDLLSRVVQLARHALSHIVIDLDTCDLEEASRVLQASDCVVLVLRPDFVSVHRARRLIEFLSRAKFPREQLALVANRLGPPKSIDASLIEEVLGAKIQFRLPEDPDAVNRSVNLGSPVVIERPRAKISTALASLADALVGGRIQGDDSSWSKRQLDRLRSVFVNPPTSAAASNGAAH